MIPNSVKSYLSLRSLTVMVLGTVALLMVAFLPTLFQHETALQIRVAQHGTALPDGFYVYQRLNAQGIQIKSITPDKDALVIKFDTQAESSAAEKVLRELLPVGFDIAQIKGTSSAKWLNRISSHKQSVG